MKRGMVAISTLVAMLIVNQAIADKIENKDLKVLTCEFPTQLNVKNFSFSDYGYFPKEYALKDDTYGLFGNEAIGNSSIYKEISSESIPIGYEFDALIIIAACGNSDAMYTASQLFSDKKIVKFWLENAMKKNNINAIRKYYTDIEINEMEKEKRIALALYNISTGKETNEILQKKALEELIFNETYKKYIIQKLPDTYSHEIDSFSSIYSIYESKKLSKNSHIEQEWSKNTLNILEYLSKVKNNPEATLELIYYYSWRDLNIVNTFKTLYDKNNILLSSKIYKNMYEANDSIMVSSIPNLVITKNIINQLSEIINEIQKTFDSESEFEKFELNRLDKLNQQKIFYNKLSLNSFDKSLDAILQLTGKDKIKLFSLEASSNYELINDICNFMINLAKEKNQEDWQEKNILKKFNTLSIQSKNIIKELFFDLITNNPPYAINPKNGTKYDVRQRAFTPLGNLIDILYAIENEQYINDDNLNFLSFETRSFSLEKFGYKISEYSQKLIDKINIIYFANQYNFNKINRSKNIEQIKKMRSSFLEEIANIEKEEYSHIEADALRDMYFLLIKENLINKDIKKGAYYFYKGLTINKNNLYRENQITNYKHIDWLKLFLSYKDFEIFMDEIKQIIISKNDYESVKALYGYSEKMDKYQIYWEKISRSLKNKYKSKMYGFSETNYSEIKNNILKSSNDKTAIGCNDLFIGTKKDEYKKCYEKYSLLSPYKDSDFIRKKIETDNNFNIYLNEPRINRINRILLWDVLLGNLKSITENK